jgi:hypothetical protein
VSHQVLFHGLHLFAHLQILIVNVRLSPFQLLERGDHFLCEAAGKVSACLYPPTLPPWLASQSKPGERIKIEQFVEVDVEQARRNEHFALQSLDSAQ